MKKKKTNKSIIIILLLIIITFSCQKEEIIVEARPSVLLGTMYNSLDSLGGFSHYIKAIDRTEYAERLKNGGSWTIFPPNDEAFETFMKQEGYNSVADIPSTRLYHIIQYSIYEDAWSSNTLTYNSTSIAGSGFYEGTSFRRYTYYKDTIIDVNIEDYASLTNIDPGVYKINTSYGRNKTISYFLPSYMESNHVEVEDVNFMFDGIDFNEGNKMVVEGANVVQKDVFTGNGVFHSIDKVIEPRLNLYQNLSSEEYKGKYSMFKKLIERFAYLSPYSEVDENTGELVEAFVLGFNVGVTNNLLPFDPNREKHPSNYASSDNTNSRAPGLIVPSNNALTDYINGDSELAKKYNSYDDMSEEVLFYFLKTFFFLDYQNLCPSSAGNVHNVSLDLIDYSVEDIVDKKFCSNGFFVGVDKVYENKDLTSVRSPLVLDPEYGIMNEVIKHSRFDDELSNTDLDYTVFGIKNDQFVDIDIVNENRSSQVFSVVYYNEDFSVIQIKITNTESGDSRLVPYDINELSDYDIAYVYNVLENIVLGHIVEGAVNLNSDNLYKTINGDFISVKNNNVAGGDDVLQNQYSAIDVDATSVLKNGSFYRVEKAINSPSKLPYAKLLEHESDFSLFMNALDVTDITFEINDQYGTNKIISLIGYDTKYTLLVPNNEAMQQAIDDGVITDPNNLPTEIGEELWSAKRKLSNFIKLHLLKQSIVTDGVTSGVFESSYFGTDSYRKFDIQNSVTELTIKGVNGGNINNISTTGALINILSRNVVIHEIDTYLKF